MSNNRASFYLWWKENLVKHQKVPRQYENDCSFVTFSCVREVAFGEDLNSVGEPPEKYNREKREWWWRQIKSIYRWYLDMVIKRLRCINCLNSWAANMSISEIKSYVVVLPFYIKKIKRKTLQFKAQHQKRHVFCLGQA